MGRLSWVIWIDPNCNPTYLMKAAEGDLTSTQRGRQCGDGAHRNVLALETGTLCRLDSTGQRVLQLSGVGGDIQLILL